MCWPEPMDAHSPCWWSTFEKSVIEHSHQDNGRVTSVTSHCKSFPHMSTSWVNFFLDLGCYPLLICYIVVENGHRKFMSFPIKNGGSFHSYVSHCQRLHRPITIPWTPGPPPSRAWPRQPVPHEGTRRPWEPPCHDRAPATPGRCEDGDSEIPKGFGVMDIWISINV